MSKSRYVLGVIGGGIVLSAVGTFIALAQAPAQGPQQPMSFFVTSTGSGKGADLGGLAGADALCDTRAKAVGSTKTFHAYLSTQGDNPRMVVNARDRIGLGPWYNAKGQLVARSLEELHGDTLALARLGANISKASVLTEREKPQGLWRHAQPARHPDRLASRRHRLYRRRRSHLQQLDFEHDGSAQLGHFDRTGGGNASWNSAHPSRGCSQENLVSTGGAGLLYCFAIN